MSYKVKSLLYFLVFVAAAFAYEYTMDEDTADKKDNTADMVIVDTPDDPHAELAEQTLVK